MTRSAVSPKRFMIRHGGADIELSSVVVEVAQLTATGLNPLGVAESMGVDTSVVYSARCVLRGLTGYEGQASARFDDFIEKFVKAHGLAPD